MADREYIEQVTLLQLRIGFNALAKLSEEYVRLMGDFPDAYGLISQKYIDNTFKRLENQRAHLLKSIDTFCKDSDQSQKVAVKSLLDRHKNHSFTWHTIEAKIDGYLKEGNKKGAAEANLKKNKKKSLRQNKIQRYVENKDFNFTIFCFEVHLIRMLKLKVSKKTINNDLKELGLLPLKKKLEKR